MLLIVTSQVRSILSVPRRIFAVLIMVMHGVHSVTHSVTSDRHSDRTKLFFFFGYSQWTLPFLHRHWPWNLFQAQPEHNLITIDFYTCTSTCMHLFTLCLSSHKSSGARSTLPLPVQANILQSSQRQGYRPIYMYIALRTRVGKLESSFVSWELSLLTQKAHGYGWAACSTQPYIPMLPGALIVLLVT